MAKKKLEQLTPKEYADLRNISLQAVTERIRKGLGMPGVTKVSKYGRFYLLDIDRDQIKTAKSK